MNQKDLEGRLENWAKAQRSGTPGGRAIGSAEGRYIVPSNEPRSIESMLIDHNDADEVERAWGKLTRFDKDVLRYHYILRMDERVICRKLSLPRYSRSTFLMALNHAHGEIGKALDNMAETRRVQRERKRSYDLASEQPQG
jgi:hypothetical protein